MEEKEDHQVLEINQILEEHEHSEEVQEIIGAVPHWLVRSGISLIGFVLIVLLTISWFVKYPDVLNANVTITTDPSPVTLMAKNDGHLSLLKKEGDLVSKGDILAVIQSHEDWRQILQLEASLIQNEILNKEITNLGGLQGFYNTYRGALSEYMLFSEAHEMQHIQSLEAQVVSQSHMVKNARQQLGTAQDQWKLAKALFLTDSTLFARRVLSEVAFQEKKSVFLNAKRALELAPGWSEAAEILDRITAMRKAEGDN